MGAMWTLTGTATLLIACALRFNTGISKYLVWPAAMVAGSCLAQGIPICFGAWTVPWFAVAIMGGWVGYDLSIIPSALLACWVAKSADQENIVGGQSDEELKNHSHGDMKTEK